MKIKKPRENKTVELTYLKNQIFCNLAELYNNFFAKARKGAICLLDLFYF